MLTSSAPAPLRRTKTFSGSPVEVSDVRKPVIIAIMASSTATVSAMPSAVMIVVVLRTIRFRKL